MRQLQNLDGLVNHTVGRALDLFGIETRLVKRSGEATGDKPLKVFQRRGGGS